MRERNYTGSTQPIATTPMLRRELIGGLDPELAAVPKAVIVPFGKAVEQALQALIAEGVVEPQRCCLVGLPVPHAAGHPMSRRWS